MDRVIEAAQFIYRDSLADTTQVDYDDYRDVSGIKIPFKWIFSWLDGRDALELRNVQLNVPIDAAKFERQSR